MNNNKGEWLAFSLVGALAGAAAIARGQRGSAQQQVPPPTDPLGKEDGLDLLAFRQQLGFRPAATINDSAVVRQGRARVNEGFMWKLLSERMYGSWVDLPVIATREALQNSRDAIDAAVRERLIGRDDGRFEVQWDPTQRSLSWIDNGIGMDDDTFYDKFLALGETTKQAMAGSAGGGFGIAKAVILGVSTTFRWEMHTRDRRYVANGFDEPVRAYQAPFYQGTKLTVYDIDRRYHWWSVGQSYLPVVDRLKQMLASNDLRPSKRHARVRLFLDGSEIAPFFSGRGRVIGDGLDWGPKTTALVRVYRRSRSEGAGGAYVRIDGLYQFSEGFDVDVPFDVTVDLSTELSPRDEGYPLVASRNSLSGPALSSFRSMRTTLSNDYLSATKTKAVVEVFDEEEGDAAEVQSNRAQMSELLDQLLDDPEVAAGLELVKGGAQKLKAQQQQIQMRRARREQEQVARRRQQDHPEGQQVALPRMQATPMSAGMLQQRVEPKLTKRRRRTNPFAGTAVFKVNKEHFKAAKLRKYYDRPERYLNLIALWRLTCQLVLQELGGERIPAYRVGFILDDDVKAQYEVDGNNNRTLFLNPEWFGTEMRAYQGRPLAIAAVIHAKACHEITHLLGYGEHNEGFVAVREQLAEQTVNLLYPLTTLVERLLGIQPAPTAENRALKKLRRQVERLEAQRKQAEARRLAAQQMLAVRRQLAVSEVSPDSRASRSRPGAGLAALLRTARQRRQGG